ncbi:MAG: hypothetical protein A3F84_24535 [Candidatus Handelsmanbacteria bacterium RIFCSPLOWO2_12_FULL_64_10]|uniref:Xylose isomerase-like TIM barrel domain-containing protein n=1 Tax=Handelsmanbacteria sp. (strain RIFCSPLOWO2_12_FULL_64_10) TaxID=1817868 RepID=A0A1F6CLU8_HANXR|nr:MAG: hypothetical protein A3F84_24535 [Candidatus Handelsmanbacteria bacterium RIFCSPLOWO2_12_FULL_64_10]
MSALPTVPLGPHRVSRLILGDNPIYGYSHFNHLLSQHQREFHTPDRVMATLRRAEEVGINAWQNSLTERSLSDLLRYRQEGGTIQWLCLSTSQWYHEPHRVAEAARHGPIGIAPHGGGVAGRCLRENRLDLLKDILKRIRDAGVLVGLSVHDPRLLRIAEDEAWDVDYYMTALYNLAGAHREFEQRFGHPPLSEVYLREHRALMCEQVRQTKKPCIAYKVLAAGRAIRSRDQIREEIAFALKHIKPTDALLMGMYQQFNDQIGENAALVAELCQELS